MAEVEGSLQTLAEISVALAGFASLLVVLQRRTEPLEQGGGTDLFVVVGGNLTVLVFALLPLPLVQMGMAEATTWRVTGAVLAIVTLLGYFAILQLRAALLSSGVEPYFPRVSRVSVHAPLPLFAFLIAIAGGVFGAASAGAYVLALLLLVLLSSLPLLFVVIDLAVTRRDPS